MPENIHPNYETDGGETGGRRALCFRVSCRRANRTDALEPVRETDPLRIPEVLIGILEFTSPGGKATAARVCRRWCDPALNTLWQDLTDVVPFLNILALLKNIQNPRMSPAETLERIKSYGARVQTLQCIASNASIHESGTAEVYQALCRGELQQYLPTVSIPSSGLFPNLRTLEWRAEQTQPHTENTLDAVSYFLCPSLKHLYVSGIVEQVGYQQQPGFIMGPAINCVPFFRKLNAMEGLRMESLELRMREYADELTQDHEVGLFLRRHRGTLMHFHTWSPEFVRLFQKEIWELTRLQSLEVVTDEELQASRFIEGLADGAPEWQGLWDALKRLRKLTKLHLEVPEIEELEEGDVRSMKEAWPALSYLYILQKLGGWRHRSDGLSQNFLSAVTHHFSQSLTTLGLCFEPNKRSVHPISPVRLEKLQLIYIQSFSTVEDPEGLVRYFTQILPVGAILEGDPGYEWDGVAHRLERARDNSL
ncbi:hypothetical protein FRC00_006585 [Tulasnella sp. 408]|nr:hypothetical protein FRC00_006585 [Tulasnella sp. 408]